MSPDGTSPPVDTQILPVRWRGHVRCGHPRTLVDYLRPALEEQGYAVHHWESDLKSEPLTGVAEFEGGLLGRHDYPGWREDKAMMILGAALSVLIIGIFILLAVYSHRHRRLISLNWRGEAYQATGSVEGQGGSVSQVGVVSDTRLVLRGGVGHPEGLWGLSKLFEEKADKVNKGLNDDVEVFVGRVPDLTLSLPSGTAPSRLGPGRPEREPTPLRDEGVGRWELGPEGGARLGPGDSRRLGPGSRRRLGPGDDHYQLGPGDDREDDWE